MRRPNLARHIMSAVCATLLLAAGGDAAALSKGAVGPTTRAVAEGRLIVSVPEGWEGYDAPGYALALFSPSNHAWLWLQVESREDFVDGFSPAEMLEMQVPTVLGSMDDAKAGEVEHRDIGGRPAAVQRVEGSKERTRWVWVYAVTASDEHLFTIVVTARPSGMQGAMAALEAVLSTIREKRDGSDSGAAKPTSTRPTTRTSTDALLRVTLPEGWRDFDSPGHTIAAHDARAGVFFTVHGNSKEDLVDMTLDEYALMGVEHACKYIEDADVGEYEPAPLGEHATLRVEARGIKKRRKWICNFVFVETERYFHVLTLITRPTSHQEGLAALEQILASLNELKGSSSNPAATAPGR
jgi:hypothetical protein